VTASVAAPGDTNPSDATGSRGSYICPSPEANKMPSRLAYRPICLLYRWAYMNCARITLTRVTCIK